MIKPRLLILSDLYGGENPEWIKRYINLLESKFDIQYYSAPQLAGINVFDLTEAEIHNQFLNGGIDKAVDSLLKLESCKIVILGCSIGGTIAWKAALKTLEVSHLFAVSSTRLRYETELPNCKVKLYFGEKDLNKPNPKWFMDLNVAYEILQNQNHQLYLDENNCSLICDDILKSLF